MISFGIDTTPHGNTAGAVFHRCALQVNPAHYIKTFQGDDSGSDARSYAAAMVEKARELGISAMAITDHNSVDGVADFEAAATQDITIFPGFELTSSDGIHVLCIYPPGTSKEQLGRYLGSFDIHGTEPSADPSGKNFADIVGEVQNRGGIAVAAHVTGNNGLLKTMSGQTRIRAWQNENLLAIQIPGPIEDLDYSDRQIVQNKNPDYRRSRTLAAVNAKDIRKIEDLDHKSATCSIKMSDVSIEGLRQAFLDPESRIRLNGAPMPDEHSELLSIQWEGGFLDGILIPFNPNLNVLVGGRGAGKSAVLESLRYVLDLAPTGEEASKAHQGIIRNVLRGGTKISLRVRSHRPIQSEYLIERIVNNPPTVRDVEGHVSNLRPDDVLPKVEIFGQHEISELTRSPEQLTSLLDRFVHHDGSLARRKAEARQGLEQERKSLLEIGSELRQIEEKLALLPGLEETLRRYQDAGLEERLGEQTLLVREERVVNSVAERLQPFREDLESLRKKLPIDRAFLSTESLAELPGRETLADANVVMEELSAHLAGIAQHMENALAKADAGVEEIRRRWGERKADVESEYQSILRELGQSAVDGEDFIQLQRDIENLNPLRERQADLEGQAKEHAEKRRTLLTDWEDIKAEQFRALDRAAKEVSSSLRNQVQVEVTASGNREPLFQLLRDQIGGRLSEVIAKITGMPDFSLPAFVDHCRKGVEDLRKAYAIPPNQASSLAAAGDDVLMQVEELELLPTTAIRLNVSSPDAAASWQDLSKLSTGQKSTAVLLLLLLESDAPLVIDQPEDDLDNRFITEGVVPRMREEKQRRQFVFSTHNANVPVLGDAELIIGMSASGSGEIEDGRASIASEHIGSIDSMPVRDLVGQILEGGRDAFETRRLKYGF